MTSARFQDGSSIIYRSISIIADLRQFVKTSAPCYADTAMKVIHFADVHLGMENYGKFDPGTGLNSRLGDFLNSFETVVKTAIDENVELVCFAGDAFKTRDPSPTYQKAFAQKIYEIASADIPVVMLVGNHDFPGALGKAHTLEIYKTLNVPNVYTLSKDEIVTIKTKSGPIQIAGLPWYTKSQLISKEDQRLPLEKIMAKLSRVLAEKVEILSAKIDPAIPSILLAHATIEGATYGSERSVMIGSDILLPIDILKRSRFNYAALGHLHKFQVLSDPPTGGGPPVIYSGSIERVDFGEEKEDKGFVLIDFNQAAGKKSAGWRTAWQFIKTPARKFLTIKIKVNDTDPNPTETISKQIEKYDINDKVVKLIIEVSEEKQAEIAESKIREKLSRANFIAGIIKEIKSSERTQIKNGFSDELSSLDTIGILEKYLDAKKVSKTHKQDLIKTAERLIEEML